MNDFFTFRPARGDAQELPRDESIIGSDSSDESKHPESAVFAFEVIEIGSYGTVKHDLARKVFEDVWEDDGHVNCRMIPVTDCFIIESGGRTVYRFCSLDNGHNIGEWFGYERMRREDEGLPVVDIYEEAK